ncbi:MAG: class I SAM-dependent methyltransferase [Candidatus Woesearchaeota archaeon]
MEDNLGMYVGLQEEEAYFDYLEHKSRNPLRRWFHSNRFVVCENLVHKYYRDKMTIIDLGCGSCNWNKLGLPVIGVDSSKKVLDYAKRNSRIKKAIQKSVTCTGIREGTADIVLLFGVLEHIKRYQDVLREANRVLKNGGVVISSVPHDTWFSLWRPLFVLHCFFQGTILKKEYFRKMAGHVVQFSQEKMRHAYQMAGFQVLEQFSTHRMEIYTVGRK